MARVSAFLISAFCLLPFALLPAHSQVPQFRAGVDIFQLEVTVLDRDRHLVHGLKVSDFTVREDGKPQAIVGFSEVSFPEYDGPLTTAKEESSPDVVMPRYADRRLLAIIMDDWGMPATIREAPPSWPAAQQLVADAKAAAKKVVDLLGPGDFACIVLSRDTRFFPDFSNDRWKLFGAINEFKPIPRDSAERMYLGMITRGHIGGLAALQDVVEYMAKLPQHSKNIIYITTSGVGTFNAAGGSGLRVLDIIKTAQQAGIHISSIDPKGLVVGRPSDLLLTLAENTGGYAVANRNDFIQAVPQFFEETQSYYLLGYQRSGPSDGRYRKLEVRVTRPGVTTIARSGYNAPGASDMVKAPPPPVDEEVDAAIDALAHASGHQASTFALLGKGKLTVVAEIGAAQASAPKWATGGAVEARVTRGEGKLIATMRGQIAPGTRSVSLDVPLSGAAADSGGGPFHASVKISASGESLEDGTDAMSGGLLVGGPIVFRAGSSPRAPLQPVAEFLFARTERIHLDFPVLKPLTERHLRLLRRTGEEFMTLPDLTERVVDGQTVLSMDLSLSFLAAADYVLELFARSGEAAERKLTAFRVR